MSSRLRIIVNGLIGQHPMLGGITWHYLQFPLGLSRLGHDVYYIEDSGEWPYNLDGGPTGDDWIARDASTNVDHLERVMGRFGLGGKWSYRFPTEPSPGWYGMPDQKREEIIRSADLLLNVSGTLEHPEQYRAVPRLVYIDSDPVFTQVKIANGLKDFRARVDAHDVHFSFGERLCSSVPETGHIWQATRQPVVLSEWTPTDQTRDVFSTVMNWTSYKPLKYKGRSFGQKDVEFCRFLDLPGRVSPTTLEVAMSRTEHAEWQTASSAELQRMDWRLVDAHVSCGDLDSYRRYIQSSKAEWSVAKNGYVEGQPGWFSDRSACYLASGRPVVVQETGFSKVLPVGEGLVAFSTIEEAAEGIRAVEADYPRHRRAARRIAEEFFDSKKVLSQLLERALA